MAPNGLSCISFKQCTDLGMLPDYKANPIYPRGLGREVCVCKTAFPVRMIDDTCGDIFGF